MDKSSVMNMNSQGERLPDQMIETQDIQLAASMVALGSPIKTIDRYDPSRCVFMFEGSAHAKQIVDAYWHRQLSIEPQALLSALKSIKSRLYGERV